MLTLLRMCGYVKTTDFECEFGNAEYSLRYRVELKDVSVLLVSIQES